MKRIPAGHVRRLLMGWMLAAVVFAPAVARPAPAVWKGAITGDWFAAANWRDGLAPAPGDDVAITNPAAVVLLTNSTPALSSVTLSNRATLVFSNWNTTLSASNVFVLTNAAITLPPAFNVGQMSNSVRIVCENLAIGPGGSIAADAKGYLGSYMNRNGPGTGNERSGGGHGG